MYICIVFYVVRHSSEYIRDDDCLSFSLTRTLRCVSTDGRSTVNTAKGAAIIADGLRDNNTLETLELSGNRVSNKGLYHLTQALMLNTSILQKLYCNSDGITDQGAQHIAQLLKKNRLLTRLDLSFNEIGDQGVRQLASVLIHHNTTLVQLNLSWNKSIGESSVESFTEMIEYHHAFENIDISNCSLSKEDKGKLLDLTRLKKNLKLIV